MLRRHLGNWPRSKQEKRTAGSVWETWTVAAADGVSCARVRSEINFLLTFETAPFFCAYPVQGGPMVIQSPKRLELDRPQHDWPMVGVIARQHPSAKFKSSHAFQKISLFQPFHFRKNCIGPKFFNFKFRNLGNVCLCVRACVCVSAWDWHLCTSRTERFICGGFLDANLRHSVIHTVTVHRIIQKYALLIENFLHSKENPFETRQNMWRKFILKDYPILSLLGTLFYVKHVRKQVPPKRRACVLDCTRYFPEDDS